MNISSINKALKSLGLKTTIESRVASSIGGIYETVRFRTTRGGHIMIKFYVNQYQGVSIKSVCRVRDKWKPASLLTNGQASKNCLQVVLFSDGLGPKVDYMTPEEVAKAKVLVDEGESISEVVKSLDVGFMALSHYVDTRSANVGF